MDRGVPDDHKSGSVYVFERSVGGAWIEVAKLKAGDGATDDFFGVSISIFESYALVGALLDDDQGADSGSAYVFERDAGGSWTQVAKLTASDGAPGDRFGTCSLFGDLALVGAEYAGHEAGPKAGKAYLFQRGAGGTWTEVAKLQASDAKAFDRFGVSVSLLKDQVLVGAFWDEVDGPGGDSDSGSVYVFEPAACGALLAASEIVRLGSPPNPNALRPGITSGPVLGSTWDPVIDHTSFLTTAALDALAIAPTPLNLPIPTLGTLLCDPSSTLLIQTAPPRVPFAVSIPGACAFAGVTLCSQGASLDALGGILLTNALDITLGTF